jgi:hypothetical protein
MTPNRQSRNQKEKLRPELPVPHKEKVASLDVDDVEDCLALSSTSFAGEVPVPREQNVGSFERHDVKKGPAPSSTSDPRRKSKIPRGAKRSPSSAKDVLKGDSIEARRALQKMQ